MRDRIEVPPDVGADEAERLALASEKVQGFLDGAPKRVIVKPPKLVNVVA
jgi:leucyl-tRNA synthetase